MKVFITCGDAADQITARRLQALGAVNGLTVYVPPAYTRQTAAPFVNPQSARKLGDSDAFLGVIVSGFCEACRQELNTGVALEKPSMVMVDALFAHELQPYFGRNLIVIDPANPGRAELDIVAHMKTLNTRESTKRSLLALGTLALGLLIFGSGARTSPSPCGGLQCIIDKKLLVRHRTRFSKYLQVDLFHRPKPPDFQVFKRAGLPRTCKP